MPHQCVRCNSFYADDATEIINGCTRCQGKLFFYVKQAKLEAARQAVAEMSEQTKEELAADVADVIGHDIDEQEAVVVDLESIRVVAPGKYELNLQQLMNAEHPIIYKLGEGKYVVDIVNTFQRLSQKRAEKK
jgi:hypothetical protein